jgi:protease PrsW
VSMGRHALWNSSLADGGGQGFVIFYLAIGATLVLLAIFAIVVRHRQVRTLERSLQAISSRGWIHPDEIPFLSRFTYRKAARLFARQHYGRVAGKLVRRYQRLATEVAFLHHGVVSGRNIPMGVERTYALLDAMYSLRPYLRFPPALAPVSSSAHHGADGGQTAAAVH